MQGIGGEFISQNSKGVIRVGGARMALLDIESGFWSICRQMSALVGEQVTRAVLQQAGTNGGAEFARSFFADHQDKQSTGFMTCLAAYQAAGFGQFEVVSQAWPLGKLVVRARDTFEAWMVNRHHQGFEGQACAYTSGVLVGFINVIGERQDVVCIERCCQAHGDEFCEFELLPAAEVGDQERVVAFNPDPGITRQIHLLELLFERMPMGIAVIDRNFILRRVNPTWAAFIDQYTPSDRADVVPGKNIFELEPGTEEALVPLFERVFEGETIYQDAIRIESGGVPSFWDIVLTPLQENGEVIGLLNVSIDATKRIQAEERLKQTYSRLEESESMLRSVIENAQHFAIYRLKVDPSDPHLAKVLLVSPSMRELTGVEDIYNFEEWFNHLHPDDYQRVVEANRRSLAEGVPYSQPARFFNERENRWRWVQAISNPGFDDKGKLSYFDGMVIDLTEQKEAELALQESQRALATLISNLPGMAYRCQNDAEWTMKFVSEGSLELTGYSPEELVDNRKVSYGSLIHEDDRTMVNDEIQGALRAAHPFQITYRINTPTGQKWVWEQGQGVFTGDGQIAALEGFITDITARVTAKLNLEKRVEERTRQLSTLLDITRKVSSTLDLDPLLGLILDQLKPVVDYTGASLLELTDDQLQVLSYRGPIPAKFASRLRFPLQAAGANQEVIKTGQPIIIPDIQDDTVLARAFRQTAGDQLAGNFSYIRCWMGVPLMVKDQVVGMLSLDHEAPNYYSQGSATLALAFANQAAVAIENARLYSEARQRTKEIQTLFLVQQAITRRLELQSVLKLIADEACHLTSAHRAAVFLIDGDYATLAAESGEDAGTLQSGWSFPLKGSTIEEAIQKNDLVWISDTAYDSHVHSDLRRQALIEQVEARSMMVTPLVLGKQAVGALSITDRKANSFTINDGRALTLLASSAVIGIENARLYEQSRENAAAEERNRLARDLHDAVSQTLFSASLIADVLPKLWELNPEAGKQKLKELRLLTRGALSEMRTLLLELRPASLEDMDMSDLLRHLTNAFMGRTRVPVALKIGGELDPPPAVKQVFYRITQEALNNIAKHAKATQVSIQLQRSEEQTHLSVRDNGCGFHPEGAPVHSLGLGIMRERAESIGAQLTVQSELDAGTCVELSWKEGKK